MGIKFLDEDVQSNNVPQTNSSIRFVDDNITDDVQEKNDQEETLVSAASKITGIKQGESPFKRATSKTINQAKNIINQGLFGLPARIDKEKFAPRGLSPAEEMQGGLLGGEVIGGAIISGALKGFQKAYNLPAVKNNKFMEKAVDSIKKIVKPKAIAKTGKQLEMADDKIAEAMNAIYKNKDILEYVDDVGRLPQNLDEAIAASSQTKKNILEQYTRTRKAAGETAAIDLKNVSKKLRQSYKTKLSGQTAKKYALKEADRLDEVAAMGLESAESELIRYNEELAPFYNKSITGRSDVSKAGVDAKIANFIRKEVDDVVTATTGTQYQPIKNAYGAVAELEANLVKHADKLSRTPKIPGVSAFDTVPIVYGAFTGNVPLVTAGVSQKVLGVTVKRLKDPNVIVGSSFNYLNHLGTPTLLQQAIDKPFKGAAVTLGRHLGQDKDSEE